MTTTPPPVTPAPPTPSLKALNFWDAFKASGAAKKCSERITKLEVALNLVTKRPNETEADFKAREKAAKDGKRHQPSNGQIDAIFDECLKGSDTFERLARSAREALNETNWSTLATK